MERVVKYVNERFRHSGNSEEVRNQKEELIASLHDKIYDAMSKGKSEDEAFKEAVASMDGMEELTEAVDGKRRTVYVNRLNFHHSLLVFGAIALEILACCAYLLLRYGAGRIFVSHLYPVSATIIFLGIALIAVAFYPLVGGIVCAMKPKKAERVEFDFRKLITGALIGWLAISLGLAIINIALPVYAEPNGYPGEGVIYWFIWPMTGVANWPVSLVLYNVLFKSSKYQAK